MKVENTGGSVVQLEEGIYLIPGRKSGGCNVFVLRGRHKVALIDTGMPGDHDFLCASLAELGLSINDVGIVIVTTSTSIMSVACNICPGTSWWQRMRVPPQSWPWTTSSR